MAGKVIRIDLGTTNSVVAVVEGGELTVIVNQEGDPHVGQVAKPARSQTRGERGELSREGHGTIDARQRQGRRPYRSSTSRIFRPSASEVNGLCRNAIPGLRTPCWTMASSVYPDM